ncbi:MAG: HU family DNA-binding protein [Myxococcota bacterium]
MCGVHPSQPNDHTTYGRMPMGHTLTKDKMVSAMASEADITKAQAEQAFSALIDAMEETLAKDHKVTIMGFGTFDISKRAPRQGRNPQSGKPIQIPATNVVRFRAGAQLKRKVNA